MQADKIEVLIEMLKQPSTYKGILGLLSIAGVAVQPEKWQEIVGGIGTLYFLVAIFWQKS